MQRLLPRFAPWAATALAIVVGFGIAQSVASPGDDGSNSQPEAPVWSAEHDAVPEKSPIKELPDNFNLKQSDLSDAVVGEEFDQSLLERGTVSLADCPEALRFFEEPEVQRFLQDNFGYVPDRSNRWANECPSVSDLARSYDRARAQVDGGGDR